jgi:amino acid adenylation domain-containing protein
MACRLPGADSCEQYWENLRAGRGFIAEIPSDRWDVRRYYSSDRAAPNAANSKWGGLLSRVDRFDNRFFGISAREARSMDPQQRLLLEEAWHCLEDAGIPHDRLRRSTTSAYVGVMTIDYHQNVTSPSAEIDSYACLGNYTGILANRLSNFFGWKGESFALDAACAGSLTALHQARRALLAGECDYALVAGVSLIINPWHYVSFAKSRMLSPDGLCRTFDRDANGYVPGEGVVAVLLCREEDARRDGNRVHCRVLGTATSHVGASASITAPSVAAQRHVIETAAASAGIGLDTVSYVEAHGTGTALGDPIEVAALREALLAAGPRPEPCRIGSVKTAIGHLEAAAGLAGLVKVALMMRERTVAPTLNLDRCNPLIDFATGPLRAVTSCEPWEGDVLRAGVSAFGFGGTNAHAIVEAAEARQTIAGDETVRVPLMLSAKSPESFRTLWLAWRDFVASRQFAELPLNDVLGTMACGRAALEYRWAAVLPDREAVRRAFEQEPPRPDRAPERPRLLAQVGDVTEAAGTLEFLQRAGVRPVAIEATEEAWAAFPPQARDGAARFDRRRGLMYLPWALDASYLEELRGGLAVPAADEVDRIVRWARELDESNYTFKAYVEDWQRALGHRGDMRAWLGTPPSSEAQVRFLLLGCIVAAWRLSRRWSLSMPEDLPSGPWSELAQLVADSLIEGKEAIELLEAQGAAARLAPIVAARALAAPAVERPILAARSAQRVGVVELSEPPVDLVASLEGDRRALLARLWLAGVDVDWTALQPGYRVVSLPLYPFVGDRHWIELEPARSTVPLRQLEPVAFPAAVPPAAPESPGRSAQGLGLFERLDAYGAQCAFVALDRVGVLTSLGNGLAQDEVARRCLGLPRYRPLLDAVLDLLARRGLVSIEGGQVRALTTRRSAASSASALRDELEAEGVEAAALAAIVERCVRALPAVLAGETIAEDVLFPSGDASQVERLLWDHPEARQCAGIMTAAVAAAAGRCASAGRARILEVGAGTGRATEAILAALAPLAGRFEYVCTDRSRARLAAAQVRLSGHGQVRFERLDMAEPARPADVLGEFDVIVAANAFHALSHAEEALRHLKARLRPGGALILNEPVRQRDSTTLTLGLLADWWRVDAARNARGALLTLAQWREILGREYDDIEEEGAPDRGVFIARRVEAPAGRDSRPQLLQIVLQAIGEAIEADPAGIDQEARFSEIGVDSLAAGDVARLLSDMLGQTVATHAIDDHPTPLLLARYLAEQADGLRVAAPAQKSADMTVAPPMTSAMSSAPAPASGTAAALAATIVDVVAAVTESDPATIDDQVRFVDLGIESILAGDAAQLLSRRLGAAISPTVFNEHPTISALTRHLVGAAEGGSAPAPPQQTVRAAPSAPATTQVWELVERGNLASLAARDVPRRSPGAGEVEVEVFAAGLNFRDVMEGLGRLGDEPRPLGLEFSGRVTAIGPGVLGLSRGDEVVGLKIGALGRHVVTRASLVAPKPARLSFAEAACLPIVFLTAARTLESIGGLGPGRTALLHAASGGVGLAALQIARAAGATVLATAGSPEKRAYLQGLGVDCVADSRSVAFAGEVRRATRGAGVDLVLNCLAGAMTDAGLGLVRRGGVFVEIGKTDIRSAREIEQNYPGVAYAVYDLLGEIDRHPDEVGRQLGLLMNRFAAGALDPLPVRCFPFEEAAAALRFLARARHIGKVAIGREAVMPDLAVAAEVRAPSVAAAPASQSSPGITTEARHREFPGEPIAIVGMACRFPGAPDVAAFWRLLRDGVDAVGEVPAGRWSAREFAASGVADRGEARHRAGGFLDDVEHFDASLFGISPREAQLIDPQQRLLLEQTWLALADAGMRSGRQASSRTGVFVGASASDYSHKAVILGVPPDRPSLLAQMPSSLASRIGYAFDFKGPALTVDLGCASAVAAVKLAMESLRRGEVDVAVAGAVAIQSTPLLALMADQAELLSSDGRCRSFAAAAGGLGLSEGAGVVVLKRLSDAIAAGDIIHAVIRVASVSQNGATNGMSAPSVSAQVAQARAAFAECGLSPDSVSYVEGHGVGTKAGDSAEIAALAEVFGKDRTLSLGSVKSNIGHSLAAAGMAGLIKVVLQLRHGMLVPSLHAQRDAAPDLAATRLAINSRRVPWAAAPGAPRRAAINAFAINGGNGFMLVDEAGNPTRQQAAVPPAGVLVLLSGRSEAALRTQFEDLAKYLDDTEVDPCDLAATYNGPLPGLAWRAAFVGRDAKELSRQLRAAASGATAADWCLGLARRRKVETRSVFESLALQLCQDGNAGDAVAGRARLLAAAQLFVDGVDFTAPSPAGARRIGLPPALRFERQRYWLEEGDSRAMPAMPRHQPARRTEAAPEQAMAPRTANGHPLAALREAVAAVLGMPIGELSDDTVLPRLGLDSLLAFELRGRLERTLGVAPEVADLLADRPMAELAAGLPANVAARPRPIAASPAERHEPFPLTDIQLAYWLGRTEKFALGGPCHVYWEFVLPGPRDVERLENAFNRLVEMHDMLRAVVGPDGLQRVLPSVPRYQIERRDWRNGNADEGLAALREEMARESFAPAKWPLFRVVVSQDARQSRIHLGIDLLVIDVPSLALLLDQWGRLYREPKTELPVPRIAFRDYVLHQKRQQEGEAYRSARAYWAERASNLAPAPQLLGMKPFEAGKSWSWQRHRGVLDEPTWKALQRRTRSEGLTPVAALVSSFAEVLARVAVARRFTLNLTVNDRQNLHPDIGIVVGDFTSTVLLDVDLAGEVAFASRARTIGRDVADHLGHASYTGVKVLQQRGGSGDAALMPVVFTSMLGYGSLSASLGRLEFGATRTPQVWLDVQVMEDEGALVVTWDVIDALFPDGLIGGTFRNWLSALRQLAIDDGIWRQSLAAWLDEQERSRRARRNATGHAMAEDLLHEPFLRQALSHPERAAVIATDRTVTYGELLGYSLAVSEALGFVAVDSLVAVAAPKGWQQVAAAIGVLLAGAAYLPIDPALPVARRHHLLARGEARTVLSVAGAAADWPSGVRVIEVDRLTPVALPAALPTRRAGPGDLAYVIFTSGSTGEPKGVMIEHRAALNTVLDCNERYGVGPQDRVLGLSALGFDLSVYDIFGLLGAGGALVLPDARSVGDPAHVAELLRRHRVTLWNSVPMFVELFLEGGRDAAEALGGVRLVMMSGDWIPLDLPPRLRQANPGIELVSMGGATEASIWSIAYPIGTPDPAWTSVPYGFPMRNQRFHVLDEDMKDCPDWVAGELYIGGAGLARGYWRDPATTNARFVDHPVTGERLYRTGDHGRYRDDGVIEFLGRIDGQVKVGGYRIELGEIEAALVRHPAVRQAAVVVRTDARGHKSLAAFHVSRDGANLAAETLRAHLARTLPGYMMPASFRQLGALPLNANEKVDRRALAAWPDGDAAQPQSGSPQAAPVAQPKFEAQALEGEILRIWREVLVDQSLSAELKLSEQGAHSFHAVEANTRINRELGIDCSVTDIYEFATVRALAAELAGRHLPSPASGPVRANGQQAAMPKQANGHSGTPVAARSQRRRRFRASVLVQDATHG